jgi:uncharacterized protein YcbX
LGVIGRVLEIGRFPIKSMLGEAPVAATVDATGFVGDRAYALVDAETGKVASAKDPRRWGALLQYRATYVGDPGPGSPITITLPDGALLRTDEPNADARLSALIGRSVRLLAAPPPEAAYDNVWDVEGIAPEALIDSTLTGVTDDGRRISTVPAGVLAPGTFQDVAPVTVLTTASLAAMSRLQPASRWDSQRFRANLLIEVDGEDFIENTWAGRRLAIGDALFEIMVPTPRCVMTTLPQSDLTRDREILRAIARHNRIDVGGTGRYACLGAYASVVRSGTAAVGDVVELI